MHAESRKTAPLLILCVLTLLLLSTFILSDLTDAGRDNAYLSVIIMQLLVYVIPAIFYSKIKGEGYALRLNLKLFAPSNLFFMLWSFLALFFCCSLLKLGLYRLGVEPTSLMPYPNFLPSDELNAANAMYLSVAFALVPALAEEFLFRSVFMTEYEDCGPFTAIAVGALLSAMTSFSFAAYPLGLLTGLCFGVTAYVTRSVLAAAILHLVYNLSALFLDDYVAQVIMRPDNAIFLAFALSAAAMLFTTLALSAAERIYRRRALFGTGSPAFSSKESFGRRFVQGILSPGVLICAALFLIASLGQI